VAAPVQRARPRRETPRGGGGLSSTPRVGLDLEGLDLEEDKWWLRPRGLGLEERLHVVEEG